MAPAGFSADHGSFRDSVNRVYSFDDRILRGNDAVSGNHFRRLLHEDFFLELLRSGSVVQTHELDPNSDTGASMVRAEGWPVVLEHEIIPFISYPYEWSFSMLRDAALLHLDVLETCMEHGWTLKDASPYNVQFKGGRPIFIDTGSFEPWVPGEPWIGYRQFCSMFLAPLLLKKHLGIDYLPILRSRLDGIEPGEAAKYFRGFSRLKSGVPSHILLPAMIENSISRKERDRKPAQLRRGGRHSKAMVLGLVQSLKRVVRKLEWNVQHTDWSQYASNHSYQDADFVLKKTFVEKHISPRHWASVWDVGCNTGTFSKLVERHSDFVLALDGDHDSIEQLYLLESSAGGSHILPMVMDLANISPNQGWAGRERQALDSRHKPDLVMCLALIHHIRVSANVPVPHFLDWLRSLGCAVILEFVNREDEMFKKLLANKSVEYADYNLASFVAEAEKRYDIVDRQPLKGGHREMFFLIPR